MTVSEIYELVGGNILENIKHDNWTEAKLFIQGDNNYVETKGTYKTSDHQSHQLNIHDFDDEVDFALMELHEIMTEGGNNKWNRAVFTLLPTSKFDIEFIWDQELQDDIERLSK